MDAPEFENRHNRMIAAMEGQNEIFKRMRTGINKINDSLKNTNWSLEEIRCGGKTADAGTVDAKGGCLLATINRNLVSVMERKWSIYQYHRGDARFQEAPFGSPG